MNIPPGGIWQHEEKAAHRAKLHSTNPLERLNGEIKRRTELVGIFPDEAAKVGVGGVGCPAS